MSKHSSKVVFVVSLPPTVREPWPNQGDV